MLFYHDHVQTMLLASTYMLIYNLTSFLLFSTFLQLAHTNLKTLFSLSNLGTSSILTKVLSLTLLSLAGVPPLAGFFSKIFLFVLISHSHLFIIFPPFFVLLFIGLYFYVQNLRFLNSTNPSSLNSLTELSPKLSPPYFVLMLPICFFTVFGFCYMEDLVLILSWILL
mgnify:CR=1 FL=1